MTLFWRESRPRGRAGLRVPESLVGNSQEHMLGTKGTNGKCFINSSRRRAGQHVCEGPTGARSRNQISEHRQWPKRFARRGLPWGKRFSALLPARSLGFELQGKTVYSRILEDTALLPLPDPFRSMLVTYCHLTNYHKHSTLKQNTFIMAQFLVAVSKQGLSVSSAQGFPRLQPTCSCGVAVLFPGCSVPYGCVTEGPAPAHPPPPAILSVAFCF